MSQPTPVDATVNLMVALLLHAQKDPEFARRVETDLPAAATELGLEVPAGETPEYRRDGDGHRIRVVRGETATTISVSAEGGLRIDGEPLFDGEHAAAFDDELSDDELLAVAGGGSFTDDCCMACATGHYQWVVQTGTECFTTTSKVCKAWAFTGPYTGQGCYVSCLTIGG